MSFLFKIYEILNTELTNMLARIHGEIDSYDGPQFNPATFLA
jgi:hypothetical protein